LEEGPYEDPDEDYEEPWGPIDPAYGTNGFAVASLVLSLVWVGGVGAILGIIFGVHAHNQIRLYEGKQAGWGMATAGIVIGIVGLASIVIIFIALIAVSVHSSGPNVSLP
jgi:hypothetical protein